jgi:hypothetical protein
MWSKRFLTVTLVLAGLVVPVVLVAPVSAADLPPGGTFQDDNGSVHEGDIEAIRAAGITNGCATDRYCPAQPVPREQMAAFLDRALALPPTDVDFFSDDGSSPFQDSINRLASAGISLGCAQGRYCPAANVTRAEMASFLVRAFELAPSATDHFSDDDGLAFETDIDALAGAGITHGCAAGRYCPHGAVTRAEMASFLARALGLDPIVPPAPTSSHDTTLYVDVSHPSASDSNPGSAAAPLATIQAAIDRADGLRKSGNSVQVLIAAGVYREHVHVGHSTADAPPLLVEAAQPGTVRITGTDAWTGWSPVSGSVYARSWPFDWAPASGVSEIVGRRELAFHAGTRLRQVLSFDGLAPGSFFVDASADRIYVSVAGGQPSNVEVAVRPQLLKVDGAKNVTVRGIEFSGAASPFDTSAVQITNVSNVTMVDNVVRDNSWVGMSNTTSSAVSLISNRVIANGGGGIGAFQVSDLLLDGNETSSNNWRGVQGDYTGWTIAAVKIVGSHNVTANRHTSTGNHTRGFWIDYDVPGFTMRDSVLCNNLTDGLFIEAAQGPSAVSGTTLCDNGRYGLLISNGRTVSITGSVLCGNGKSALRLETDRPEGRTINTASGSITLNGADHLTLAGNILGGSPRLFDSNLPSSHWTALVNTIQSDMNVFSTGSTTFYYEQGERTLADWQGASGEDGGSSLASAAC